MEYILERRDPDLRFRAESEEFTGWRTVMHGNKGWPLLFSSSELAWDMAAVLQATSNLDTLGYSLSDLFQVVAVEEGEKYEVKS